MAVTSLGWFRKVLIVSVLVFQPTAITCKGRPTARAATQSSDAANLKLNLAKDGSYRVSIRDTAWITSAPSFFNVNGIRYSQNENLKLVSNVTREGRDLIGRFVSVTYRYLAGQNEVTTSFRKYVDDPLLYFSQGYVKDVKGSRAQSTSHTISGFPAFRLNRSVTTSAGPLGYLAYGGIHCADTDKTFGIFGPDMKMRDGLEGGPLVLYDGSGDAVVVSPASHFMAASQWLNRTTGQGSSSAAAAGSTNDRSNASQSRSDGALYYGIMGGVDHVPADTVVDFVVCYRSGGVNEAMETWGYYLRRVYGKTDSNMRRDFNINYLGYYTSNGAYYYYHTEPTQNYQATLLDVYNYAVTRKIPYRHIQYDSWWYYQGVDKGVKTWEPMPSVFPNGLRYMLQKTGLRPKAHNRYWASDTTYATQNRGSYRFVIDNTTGKALPLDQKFWTDLLGNATRQWGLRTYEQDWLNVQLEQLPALQTSLTLGSAWLTQMARAAAEANITIHYCMGMARHALHSLTTPVVTQVRASDDYQPGNGQWKIGVTSLMAHALAVAPFKDTFWTSSPQPRSTYKNQHGDDCDHDDSNCDCDDDHDDNDDKNDADDDNHEDDNVDDADDADACHRVTESKNEPNPELQLTVAVLSTGSVGPGDGIGYTNISLLMRCCNADGLILKPSKPATLIDDQMYKRAFGSPSGQMGEVWTTYTVVSGVQFGVIFAPDITGPYKLTPSMAGLSSLSDNVYEAHDPSRAMRRFSEQSPLVISQCRPARPCLFHTAPVFNSNPPVILLGEVDKVVPVSPQRFTAIDVTGDDVILHVQGAPGESVPVAFYLNFSPDSVTCVIPPSGNAVLNLTARHC